MSHTFDSEAKIISVRCENVSIITVNDENVLIIILRLFLNLKSLLSDIFSKALSTVKILNF